MLDVCSTSENLSRAQQTNLYPDVHSSKLAAAWGLLGYWMSAVSVLQGDSLGPEIEQCADSRGWDGKDSGCGAVRTAAGPLASELHDCRRHMGLGGP
jgi:hypothetical protein